MITFRCRCSHQFNVIDDQAGESLQCPSCGLLVDVPTIDDLPGIRDDGSYEFDDKPQTVSLKDANPLRNTPSIMSKETADRRPTLKEFLSMGTSDDDLLEIRDEVKAGVPKHPKYDPETGELIVPLAVRKEPKPAPMMALPVTLAYERKKHDPSAAGIFSPFIWMFRMPNIVACTVVTLFFLMTFVLTSSGFLAILSPVVIVMLIAHYANVVDETGPTNNDEVPALLRSANLYDDFLRPCVQVVGAYVLAIAPIFLVNLYVARLPLAIELGSSIFLHLMIPAILLTMITSGAFNNLLPSRIFSVIIQSGWHYWVATFTGYVAILAMFFAIYVSARCGNAVYHVLFVGPMSGVPPMFGMSIKIGMLLAPFVVYAAMYLVHVYAWQLGLLYRFHHERFGWVWQKHDKSTRTDVQAQLHGYRDQELKKRAARARAALEQRAAQQGSMPVAKPLIAKPVEPRR